MDYPAGIEPSISHFSCHTCAQGLILRQNGRVTDPTPLSKETRRQQRAWRRQAASYDRKVERAERTMLDGSREWVGARASGRVLEVAVGTGRSLPYYPSGIELVGIDLSPEVLAIARDRAAVAGVDAELRQADAETLPFDDASFDTVVCALDLAPSHGRR